MDNWINVKDKLPDIKQEDGADTEHVDVLVIDRRGQMYVGYLQKWGICGYRTKEEYHWYERGTGCGCCSQDLNPTHWMPLPKPPTLYIEDPIERVIQEISNNHSKIIDDWCKAYLAQLYEEGQVIKPGCFTLCMQQPTFHQEKNCMVERYWFEPGTPVFEDKPSLPWNETEEGKQRLLDLLNQTYYFHKDGTITEKKE